MFYGNADPESIPDPTSGDKKEYESVYPDPGRLPTGDTRYPPGPAPTVTNTTPNGLGGMRPGTKNPALPDVLPRGRSLSLPTPTSTPTPTPRRLPPPPLPTHTPTPRRSPPPPITQNGVIGYSPTKYRQRYGYIYNPTQSVNHIPILNNKPQLIGPFLSTGNNSNRISDQLGSSNKRLKYAH